MIGALFLAAVTPVLVSASPPPAAALPEIGRVRSNVLCTTLRQNIAPTVAGLMKNDEIIGAGHRAFAKMAGDSAGTSGAAIDIDKLYLEQVQTRLVHNLRVIDQLLGDPKRFPATPKNDDERDAVTMRGQLLAVAASQRSALDLISGTLDTEALGQMQHDLNGQMKSATGQVAPQPSATGDPVSFIGTAGLPDYVPAAGVPTKNDKTSTLAGHTIYDSIITSLEDTQTTIARREVVASNAVVNAVGSCRANTDNESSPSPAPAASP